MFNKCWFHLVLAFVQGICLGACTMIWSFLGWSSSLGIMFIAILLFAVNLVQVYNQEQK